MTITVCPIKVHVGKSGFVLRVKVTCEDIITEHGKVKVHSGGGGGAICEVENVPTSSDSNHCVNMCRSCVLTEQLGDVSGSVPVTSVLAPFIPALQSLDVFMITNEV